jgi:cytochrome c5
MHSEGGAAFLTFLVTFAALIAPIGVASMQARPSPLQADGKTVWNGVYSADQAARGRQAYETSCSTCQRVQRVLWFR